MNVQKRLTERKAQLAKARATKKTYVGRARWFGWTIQGEKRDRIHLSENSGLSLERTTMKGVGGTHPREVAADPNQRHWHDNAGRAFAWWGNQTPAERQATIAALVAENEPKQTKAKAGMAKKKSPS